MREPGSTVCLIAGERIEACMVVEASEAAEGAVLYTLMHGEDGEYGANRTFSAVVHASGSVFTTADRRGPQPVAPKEVDRYRWVDPSGNSAAVVVAGGLPRALNGQPATFADAEAICDEKAAFRVLRDTLGLTQEALADILGTDSGSVRQWEDITWACRPPETAWETVRNLREGQLLVINGALEAARANLGCVDLIYYDDELEYAADDPVGSTQMWQYLNANTRLIAHELERQGCKVRYRFNSLRLIDDCHHI